MGRVMVRYRAQSTAEAGLIARAAEGDRDAFGQLYERYVVRVFRHVYVLMGDPKAAEDLTADTFLKALEAMPRYEVRGIPYLAWLLRIAHNLTINHKKSAKNRGHAQLPEDLRATRRFSLPEEACHLKLEAEEMWRQVRTLRDSQRQVIVMRFVDGLRYAEIAKVMGKSESAVRVIQYRALSSLRETMGNGRVGRFAESRAG
jgi:RNA polymerase sigma-70 factor (ECF subfamily)